MAGVNKVILVGNLGSEPDIRATASGGSVANISIATSESWTDKNTGQKKERTTWHRVCFFGRLSEIVQQYLHKGSKVYIEGSLRENKWTDIETGQERSSMDVVAREMQMLDSRNDSTSERQGQNTNIPSKESSTKQVKEDIDSDIPF